MASEILSNSLQFGLIPYGPRSVWFNPPQFTIAAGGYVVLQMEINAKSDIPGHEASRCQML